MRMPGGIVALLAATALLGACGGGKQADCEKAKQLYLDGGRARANEAIAGAPDDMKASLRAAADKELAQADARFMAACEKLDKLDLGCFEDRDRQDTDEVCKAIGKQLGAAIYGP